MCQHGITVGFIFCLSSVEKQFFVSPEKLRKMSYAVMVLAGRNISKNNTSMGWSGSFLPAQDLPEP